MKSYYYFVRQSTDFCHDDVVYKVGVGISKRDQTKLCLIETYCEDCGLYFQKVSATSDQAILNLAESLWPNSKCALLMLKTASISISDLYSRIVDDRWSDIEREAKNKHSFFRLLACFDARQPQPHTKFHSITTCPPGIRKNLSLLLANDVRRAAVCTVGILFLIMLDCLVCTWMGWS